MSRDIHPILNFPLVSVQPRSLDPQQSSTAPRYRSNPPGSTLGLFLYRLIQNQTHHRSSLSFALKRMMMSMTIQPHFTGSLKFSTFPHQKLALKPFKASVSVHRKFTSAIFESNTRLSARELIVSASSAAGAIAEDASTENTATDSPQEKEVPFSLPPFCCLWLYKQFD